jgi:PD-(D/E)XK nuclease superfamily protein
LDNVLTTNQRGAVTEAAIVKAAIELGIGVFRPLMDERYDLILDLRPRLLRVQCKTAVVKGEIIIVRCYSTRRSAAGLVKKTYTGEEVDAVASYAAELDRCFLIPIARIDRRTGLQLRLGPTRNNQINGINWASDFDFAATLSRLKGP